MIKMWWMLQLRTQQNLDWLSSGLDLHEFCAFTQLGLEEALPYVGPELKEAWQEGLAAGSCLFCWTGVGERSNGEVEGSWPSH